MEPDICPGLPLDDQSRSRKNALEGARPTGSSRVSSMLPSRRTQGGTKLSVCHISLAGSSTLARMGLGGPVSINAESFTRRQEENRAIVLAKVSGSSVFESERRKLAETSLTEAFNWKRYGYNGTQIVRFLEIRSQMPAYCSLLAAKEKGISKGNKRIFSDNDLRKMTQGR